MSLEKLSPSFACDMAANFFKELDKAMCSDFIGPQQIVLNGLDALYDILTQTEVGVGYVVMNAWENGNQIDLLHGVTKEYWDAVVYDEDLRSGNNILFFDLESSRQSFLITLGTQVLLNVPKTAEEARLHLKRHVASVFNGMNFYRARFRLVFIDYNAFDGEYLETDDLGDMLVV